MYSRAEASHIKHTFWTSFGRYIAPQPNSEGRKINWVNYHTSFKHVYFRMNAGPKKASIGIELAHPDIEVQEMFFDKFTTFRTMLHGYLNEEWTWEMHTEDENGKTVSRIYTELAPVNVLNQNDWPQIISFLKPRIIALDEFWNDVKVGFEELR